MKNGNFEWVLPQRRKEGARFARLYLRLDFET